MRAVSSPATSEAAISSTSMSHENPDPRMSSPSSPRRSHLLQRLPHDGDLLAVLGVDADEAARRPDGVGPDQQPFENGVGVAPQQEAGRPRPRVGVDRVADGVLLVSLGVLTDLPLLSPSGSRLRPCPAGRSREVPR